MESLERTELKYKIISAVRLHHFSSRHQCNELHRRPLSFTVRDANLQGRLLFCVSPPTHWFSKSRRILQPPPCCFSYQSPFQCTFDGTLLPGKSRSRPRRQPSSPRRLSIVLLVLLVLAAQERGRKWQNDTGIQPIGGQQEYELQRIYRGGQCTKLPRDQRLPEWIRHLC